MLPRAYRLTDADGFRRAVRRGRRAASRTVVVHLEDSTGTAPASLLVGFVVSKAVGPSVVRNRVKRRLRHQAREQLSSLETRLPGSAVLVVRALPPAAGAESAELGRDLARCLERVLS